MTFSSIYYRRETIFMPNFRINTWKTPIYFESWSKLFMKWKKMFIQNSLAFLSMEPSELKSRGKCFNLKKKVERSAKSDQQVWRKENIWCPSLFTTDKSKMELNSLGSSTLIAFPWNKPARNNTWDLTDGPHSIKLDLIFLQKNNI